MFKYTRILATLALVASVLLAPVSSAMVRAQEPQDDEIGRLMASMSTVAKVGQLSMATFPGAEVTEDALIVELLRDYQVGGVLLLPENGNIENEDDTLTQVSTLVSQLQQTARSTRQPLTGTLGAGRAATDPYIPSLRANDEGNGAPYTSISNGTTPLPLAMAQGATWDPSCALAIGGDDCTRTQCPGYQHVAGSISRRARIPTSGEYRGSGRENIRWRTILGRRDGRSLHPGRTHRCGWAHRRDCQTLPRSLGASDRSLQEEVPTVQRTLEELRQVDLAPFFAVVQSQDEQAHPDGVMVSHIRLRGLEGGRFVTTRPISVDSQVLQRLLSLPELANWANKVA